ncbi:MAG: beta-ketoacyl-[acyl-carrier-protein] synthase family protein [bacterium]|nr:beta-ketoacyl-[acyl-carrier-protein] synthase family protein [bacterium]
MSVTRKRIVVTGMGVLSSIGKDVAEFKQSLLDRRCGISASPEYRKYFDGAYASEIDYAVDYPGLDPDVIKNVDKGALWAYRVGREALLDSDLFESPLKEKIGLMMGISAGGTEAFLPALLGEPEKLNWKMVQNSGSYSSVSHLAASLLDLGGGFELVSTACTASPNAIGLAFDAIQNNKSEVMLAVGSEPLYIPTFAGFYALKAMADGPCSPFSGVAGMSIGEGAGALVLEEYEHAKKRGAPIYAEILSYATTGDAYHETAPDPKGEGASFVMNFALRNAGLEAKDIEYINAHGTGTEANDRAETLALGRVFAENRDVPISSTKSYFGHNIGSAGVLELIACMLTLSEDKILPTLNFSEARSYCDLNYVPNDFREQKVNVFMKNNYAFGGNNCCMIVSMQPDSKAASTYEPRRVAITGLGTVSSLGANTAAFFEKIAEGVSPSALEKLPKGAAGPGTPNLIDGGSAPDAVATGDTSEGAESQGIEGMEELLEALKNLPVDEEGNLNFRFHRVVKFNARKLLRNFDPRKMNEICTFALVAVEEAIADAGYKVPKGRREEVGMIMGMSRGPTSTIQKLTDSLQPNPNNVRTKEFAMSLMNSIATQCSIARGVKGYNTTLATGYNASLGALMQAYEVLRQDLQDYMVVGASDEKGAGYTPIMHLDQTLLNYDADPTAYQVYSAAGDGYFAGEGSCCMLLEKYDAAKERGAEIYGEIVGYGRASDRLFFNDADHDAQDHWGRAMGRAITLALNEAGIAPKDVDMICGSSWGTRYSNLAELQGVRHAFGEAAKDIPLTNFNNRFGFIEAASGQMNLAATLHCMRENTVFPILYTQDFAVDGLNYATEAIKKEIRHALVLGVSEGGNNYALLVRRPE